MVLIILDHTKQNYYNKGMITPKVWMFLSFCAHLRVDICHRSPRVYSMHGNTVDMYPRDKGSTIFVSCMHEKQNILTPIIAMIDTDTNTLYCQNKCRIKWFKSSVFWHINKCTDIPQLLNHNDLDYHRSFHYNEAGNFFFFFSQTYHDL